MSDHISSSCRSQSRTMAATSSLIPPGVKAEATAYFALRAIKREITRVPDQEPLPRLRRNEALTAAAAPIEAQAVRIRQSRCRSQDRRNARPTHAIPAHMDSRSYLVLSASRFRCRTIDGLGNASSVTVLRLNSEGNWTSACEHR